ncbi:hypothetical protein RB195_001904 [Necator americanus]|uniref:PDZ/DHR/GLGF domain protein n=2 Tax=Necator americanus TaxID=51031 RepID=A0ABR1DGG2_NECAM
MINVQSSEVAVLTHDKKWLVGGAVFNITTSQVCSYSTPPKPRLSTVATLSAEEPVQPGLFSSARSAIAPRGYPLTSRQRGYQGSDEGDNAETKAIHPVSPPMFEEFLYSVAGLIVNARSMARNCLGANRALLVDKLIAVTILARESDVLAFVNTLEAFYITAKSPIMNRKEECIAVTNELAPHQDLCGGAALTTGGPLTSRFRGYQGCEEGDDAETLARIKINNNLDSKKGIFDFSSPTMTTDGAHRTECVTIAEVEHETDDMDSAIDLVKEIEDLDKLQLALDRMLECPNSPSTSLASSSGRETGSIGKERGVSAVSSSVERLSGSASSSPRKREGLAARRLIRVPCGRTASACASHAGVQNVPIPFTVFGGAAAARLILVDIVKREDLIGILNPRDIVLKIEDTYVSGMLRSEVTRLLEKLCNDTDQIAIEILPAGAITDDICEILADKQWAELQTTIRDNLYSKTVPYTTRPPRDGEIDGEHYRFVSVDEFTRLQAEGLLLEHGTYQGHLYGTPRPEEGYEGTAMVSSSNKGPLPPNWEIGYAENGDKYFIDHNSGTTTWDDPRDLPPGWEQVDDPEYGTFFVDHVNKKTQYERPSTSKTAMSRYDTVPTSATSGHVVNGLTTNGHRNSPPHQTIKGRQSVILGTGGGNPYFTRDPAQLRGEMVSTTIVKGAKGLGFTLIGNDASSKGDEFIQVKSVLPGGPAAEDGVLRAGDVLVRVNGELLLGASQTDACRIFVNIPAGDPVAIQVCRGYPLLLDPSNRIITENVYQTGGKSRDLHDIDIIKGPEGFGFTIADSASGQRVKKILYPEQCANLLEGDTIVELDGRNVRAISHTQLVDMLRECPIGHRGRLVVRRSSPKHRSRTPAAEFRYGEQTRATPLPIVSPRSKTPAPISGGRHEAEPSSATLNARAQTLQRQSNVTQPTDVWDGTGAGSRMKSSSTTLGFATPNYMPLSAFQFNKPTDLIIVNLIRKPSGFGFRLLGGSETNTLLTVGQVVPGGAAAEDGRMQEGDEIVEIDGRNVEGVSHAEAVSLLEHAAHNKHVKLVVRRPRMAGDSLRRQSLHVERPLIGTMSGSGEYDVTLSRNDTDGFGFIIISSLNRTGSTIGQILENSPAEKCGRLKVGDRVVAVNGIDILNLSHGEIVGLIKASGLTVRLTIAPPHPDGSPLASSTLNRTTIPSMSYAPSPPTSFIPPPPMFQNGGLYATVGRNTNYATYQQPSMTPSPFSYTNGSVIRSTSNYSAYPDIGRPIYTTSHINGQLNGMTLQNTVPPEQDGPIISVELERGVRGFGFSIRGGQEFGAMPLFVLRIAEDGPAAVDGRLKVGDQLISINGRDTKGLTHEEAIQLIKQHPTVRLTIRRHKLP